eukprot:6903849-Prymnesium_polylepis.1
MGTMPHRRPRATMYSKVASDADSDAKSGRSASMKVSQPSELPMTRKVNRTRKKPAVTTICARLRPAPAMEAAAYTIPNARAMSCISSFTSFMSTSRLRNVPALVGLSVRESSRDVSANRSRLIESSTGKNHQRKAAS